MLLGDHTSLAIKGIGSIPMKMHDGLTLVLNNVRWVPGLRRSLLSESAFDDLDCRIITHKGIRTVIKHDKILIKYVKRNAFIMCLLSLLNAMFLPCLIP